MRKTLIGIMIMTVAIMMTLSGAVFAAETVTMSVNPTDVKVGDTVTVTVKHPAGATGAEYTVKYDPAVLSTDKDTDHDGSFKAIGYTPDNTEYATQTLTFKALKEGSSEVALSNIKIAKSGEKIDTEATASTTVTVKGTEATPTPEPTAEPTPTPKADDTKKAEETKTDADTTKKTLKDTKTGFDAMYVVYLAAAVLVAGGIVTVARRK